MGIQGLLPFLKKIHTPVNVAQFQGCTVAIDAYCWLHKGAFSCADKLALGEKTDQYVYYCMKYVDYLLRNGLKPILVFDGCHLPSKKDVETSRREKREMNRKRAAQLLREGKRAEAKECLQRCVDISPQMALELMNVCRARGVDCIVAPYEADAQLAYLNKAGIAQIIITEDSDLLLFGCEKVIFKMDFFGNGVLIERSRLNEVVDIQEGFYTFDKFRYMCILSGCDYLPSLPGIGLAKACKVFKVARQADIRQVLKKLPSYLKMNIVVPNEYIENFVRADNTFLYQLTFDPISRRLCPLTPYPPEVDRNEMPYAGAYFANDLALQIALGNVDIHTHEKISDFNPKTYKPKYAKKQESERLCMLSIWNPSYRPMSKNSIVKTASDDVSERPNLTGKEVHVKNSLPKRSPVKRVRAAEESAEVRTDGELACMYATQQPKQKKARHRSGDEDNISADLSIVLSPKEDTDSDDADSIHTSKKERDSKQVLSPSKLMNCLEEEDEDLDNTSSSGTRSRVVRRLGDAQPEEKENQKALTPKVNKFAVSALAKRAKFSLDAPSANVRVEVKSRYFGSSDTQPSPAGVSEKLGHPSSVTAGETQETSVSQSTDSALGTARSGSASDLDKRTAKEISTAGPECVQSPEKTAQATSSLSKFIYTSSPKQTPKLKSPPSGKSNTKSSNKLSKTAVPSKASPGSAFNWSKFKFTKSSSTPNFSSTPGSGTSSNASKPFKRVSSEDTVTLTDKGERTYSSQPDPFTENLADSLDQKLSVPCTSLDTVETEASSQSQSDTQESLTTPSNTQASETDGAAADFDSSQRSNLCSIDSDCFPTSQDFVDLTDGENDNQWATEDTKSSGRASDGGSFKSPVSAAKIPFISPASKRLLSDAGKFRAASKKCRVSGLSRGKKKAATGMDEKQQKIKDMFSRFAHNNSRLYILQGPEEDREPEGELSVTELKAQTAKLKLEAELRIQAEEQEEEEQERQRQKILELRGCSWGMGEDATEDTATENPFANMVPEHEHLYVADPKKALKGFYEREGCDLPDYQFTEVGFGKHRCVVELPVDGSNGEPLIAEATVSGKKKDAVIACALEACRLLDVHGLLHASKHESRKRKGKNWEDDDFYDSDEDTFLDRTGTIEKKRLLRMKKSGKDTKAETYETLLPKHEKVVERITEIETKLEEAKTLTEALTNDGEDALDAYMTLLKADVMDTKTRLSLKRELLTLRMEEQRLRRLVNIAKPATLPEIKKQMPAASKQPGAPSLTAGVRKIGVAKGPRRPLPLPVGDPVAVQSGDSKFEEEIDDEDDTDDKSNNSTSTINSASSKLLEEGTPKLKEDTPKLKEDTSRLKEDTSRLKEDTSRAVKDTSNPDNDTSGPDNDTSRPDEDTTIPRDSHSADSRVKDTGSGSNSTAHKLKAKVSSVQNSSPVQKSAGEPPKSEAVRYQVKGPALPPGMQPSSVSDTAATSFRSPKVVSKDTGPPASKKKKKSEPSTVEYDASDPDYAMWLPPEGQSGDGRTSLNDKLGY
ncbi:hypothetical protein BaRGS_00003323 [Batillaria attramentaria]|uniref:Exonuclease 1 n=1 Tax=Batillaria attramentaria TaxID=370345 RepID=A0ABD0M2Q5_9CAEN